MALRPMVRGSCSSCRTYQLVANRDGTVDCAACGARDLLPEREARDAAIRGPGLEAFERRFRREVKKGRR
jgi:uncharacterized Zn finger protein (UPF0148 family)